MTRTTLEVLEALVNLGGRIFGLRIAQTTGLMTGTVYPILARLEKAGWVTSHWEEDEGPDSRGSRRRLYELTPMGRELAREALTARDARRGITPRRQPGFQA
jgi:Predicted transcriptional regulators